LPYASGKGGIAGSVAPNAGKTIREGLSILENHFIKWDTCVEYALAEITSDERLNDYLSCGLARMHRELDAALVTLVLDGFTASDRTKQRIRGFVRDYKSKKHS
jgi:hypothetical protein